MEILKKKESPTTAQGGGAAVQTTVAWKPRRKKRVWPAVIAVIAVIGLVVYIATPKAGAGMVKSEGENLVRQDMKSTIAVSGNVSSDSSENIFAKQAYRLATVEVEVGDKVKAGQVIATLDSTDLEDQIEQASLSLTAAQRAAMDKVHNAQVEEANAIANLSSGHNAQLLTAQDGVIRAKASLDSAQREYDQALENLSNGQNGTILPAENAMINAMNTYEKAKEDLKKSQSDYDSRNSDVIVKAKNEYETAKAQLDKAKEAYNANATKEITEAYESAKAAVANAEMAMSKSITTAEKALNDEKTSLDDKKRAYDQARENFEAAVSSADSSVERLKETLDSAQHAYDAAVITLEATKTSVNQSVEQVARSASSTAIATDFSADEYKLLSLKSKLDDCTIKAPIDGTITQRNADVGKLPETTLFVIDDTTKLTATAKVKEYHIANIALGMPVTITADGAGGQEYTGTVSKIAPSATSDANSKTPLFEVEVSVNNPDEKLKIGMTAQMEIETDQRTNVLSVRYESLGADAQGNTIVYVLENPDPKTGAYTARAIPVTTGLQTDMYVEVTGEGLTEGMLIASYITGVSDGAKVMVPAAPGAVAAAK